MLAQLVESELVRAASIFDDSHFSEVCAHFLPGRGQNIKRPDYTVNTLFRAREIKACEKKSSKKYNIDNRIKR